MNPVTITVYGVPGAQGSKAFKGISKSGKAIMVESSKKVGPWREAVKNAVMLAGHPHVPGAVSVEIVFTLARPKRLAAAKHKNAPPAVTPDGDKLTRATWDALTQMRVIEDDARIVSWGGSKVYEGSDWGMDSPGAVIQIAPIHDPSAAARKGGAK